MNMKQSIVLQEKENNPLVSIVIPIYNNEQYLNQCLESVCSQTYANLEIILVNDGSEDDSLDICKQFACRDSRIGIINQENQGVTCARKKGVEKSTGKFVGFVDGDDWIDSDMIESLLNIMIHENVELVSSGMKFVYEDGRTSKNYEDVYSEGAYRNNDLEISLYSKMIWDKDTQKQGMICSMVNKLFVRDLLLNVQKRIDNRIKYFEDTLCYAYALQCNAIYIHKTSYYNYRKYSQSTVYTLREELLQNSYYLFQYLNNELGNYKNPYLLYEQLNYFFVDYNKHLMKMLFQIDLKAMEAWKIKITEDIWGKHIAIYGAGLIGRVVYNEFIRRNLKDNVVAWVDQFPEGKSRLCLYNIREVSFLKKCDYDKIVIAIQDNALARKIQDDLINQYGVEKDNIAIGEYEYIGINFQSNI